MKSRQFWIALAMLLVVIAVSLATYFRMWDVRFRIGPFSFAHWLGWLGATYIAIITPLYSYLKRHSKRISRKNLLVIHIFGNLFAYLLVSIHFTQQVSRPPGFRAVQSTGLILFITLTIMILTGFLQRFGIFRGLQKSWRFVHISSITAFYLVIIIHILHFYHIV